MTWRKSSRSGELGDNCIELAELPEGVGIRDSKDPDGPNLLVGRDKFAALLAAVKR